MNEEINKAKKEGNVEALEKIQVDAEVAMEWDIAKAAENAIKEIQDGLNETKTTDIETRQITENEGDVGEITTRTAEVDAEIAEVEKETQEKIDAVKTGEKFDPLVSETYKGETIVFNPEDPIVNETSKEIPNPETPKEKFDIMDGAMENGKPIENKAELSTKDKIIGDLEKRNKEILENMSRLNGYINTANEEISRAIKQGDENSRNFWRNEADVTRNKLVNYDKELEENRLKITTFDTRKEGSDTNVESAKKELSDIMVEIESLKEEHKKAVKELHNAENANKNSYNEEREVSRLFSKIRETESLQELAQQKVLSMEEKHKQFN